MLRAPPTRPPRPQDVPMVGPITGRTAGLLWKSYESISQFSFRNVCLVSLDWLRTKVSRTTGRGPCECKPAPSAMSNCRLGD